MKTTKKSKMLCTDTMLERYKLKLMMKTSELKSNNVLLRHSLEDVTAQLEQRRLIIDKYSTKPLNVLYNSKNKLTFTNLTFKDIYRDYEEQGKIKLLLNDYITFTKMLNENLLIIETLESFKVPETVFKFIIKEFNKRMIKAVIEKAYKWDLGIGAGSILIVRTDMRIKSCGLLPIDWKATMEEKASLIEQGIEIFNIEYSPEGKEYFRFHTDPFQLWVTWDKSTINTPNYSYYIMKPVRGINDVVSKMHTYRRANPDVIPLYKYKPLVPYNFLKDGEVKTSYKIANNE